MNFGHKVAVGYTSFVIMIIGLVIFSFKQDFYLESEDYYEKEVNFSEEMGAINNFKSLGSDLKVESKSSLEIHFPNSIGKDTLDVNVILKRPDNSIFDRDLAFENATSPITISYDSLIQGIYNLEFTFQINDQPFLRKKGIYVSPR